MKKLIIALAVGLLVLSPWAVSLGLDLSVKPEREMKWEGPEARPWEVRQGEVCQGESCRAAAEKGGAKAQYKLGMAYAKGDCVGVTQNYKKAYFWLSLAASRGVGEAEHPRNVLAQILSKNQLAEAQEKAADWSPKKWWQFWR